MSRYATLEELKADISLTDTAGTATATLERMLDTASLLIDRFCNRPDGFVADAAATARYYSGNGLPYLRIDEFVEITALAVKDSVTDTTFTAWTAPTTHFAGDGDYLWATGSHKFPKYNRTPYTLLIIDPNGSYATFIGGKFPTTPGFTPTTTVARGLPTVEATAKWGYAVTVPMTVKEACIMQSARWYKRLRSSMACCTSGGGVMELI